MSVLAIDCSGPFCSAALADTAGETILFECSEDIGRGHAERLPEIVERVLAGSGITLRDVTRLAVTTGPGSFAGIRVGVAFARGLALALGVPAVGVSTLSAMGLPLASQHGVPVLALLDGRRNGLFAAAFAADGTCLLGPLELTPEQAAGKATDNHYALCGSGAPLAAADNPTLVGRILSRAPAPEISAVARIGALLAPDKAPAEPLYLREADAKPQSGFSLTETKAPMTQGMAS